MAESIEDTPTQREQERKPKRQKDGHTRSDTETDPIL